MDGNIHYNSIVAIDASSSTRRFSMDLRSAVNEHFRELTVSVPEDQLRVSALIFTAEIVVVAKFVRVGQIDVVRNFRHGWGTALYAAGIAAIDLGYEHLARCAEGGIVPKVSVAMFTDGEDSVSSTSWNKLREKTARALKDGFDLRLVGVGEDISAPKIAYDMGFPMENAIQVDATPDAITQGTQSISRDTSTFFGKGFPNK